MLLERWHLVIDNDGKHIINGLNILWVIYLLLFKLGNMHELMDWPIHTKLNC